MNWYVLAEVVPRTLEFADIGMIAGVAYVFALVPVLFGSPDSGGRSGSNGLPIAKLTESLKDYEGKPA